MFAQTAIYAAELKRDITVRSLSAAGVLRVHRASQLPDKKARRMAMMLEVLRDGITNVPLQTDKALMDFASAYPDLTARLFVAINRLTEGRRD